jgi:hypothetical protein
MKSRRRITAHAAKERASYRQMLVYWKGLQMSALGQKQTFHVVASVKEPIAGKTNGKPRLGHLVNHFPYSFS